MGRGLSTLQQTILRLALENHIRETRNDESGGCDVLHAEVLVEHYGFVVQTWNSLRHTDYQTGKERRTYGGWHFHKSWLCGYGAAQAALCRAMRRLEQRKLVIRMCGEISNWAGANLTESGMQEATKLTVKLLGTSATKLTIRKGGKTKKN